MKKNRMCTNVDSKIMFLKSKNIPEKKEKVRNQKMNKKAKLSMGKIESNVFPMDVEILDAISSIRQCQHFLYFIIPIMQE